MSKRVVRIQTPEQGNPLYPLPPNYTDLSSEGKAEARRNGVSQWMLRQSTLEQRVATYISCINLFDSYYLQPDDETGFHPMFYELGCVPDGPVHNLIYRAWASARKSAVVAPRGSGKSRLCEKDMMMRMLSWPGYSFIYATASDSLVTNVGERMLIQFRENERLRTDWGDPSNADSRILRPRGAGSGSSHRMRLWNNSVFVGTSAKARVRGGRPARVRLDDPEYDPTGSTSMSDIRDFMETLVFKLLIPMVTQGNTGIDWIGTFVTRRHYLWQAMSVSETPEGVWVADDPRFDTWYRLIIPAAAENVDTGRRESCWEQMWPATKARRLELAKDEPRFVDQVSLEEIEQDIGSAIFRGEYMADPGSAEDQFFPLDETEKGKHAWWLTDFDQFLQDEPYRSATRINWLDPQTEEHKSAHLFEFCKESRIFLTGDTSGTATATSDPKAVSCFALAPGNILFWLDLWSDRAKESKLVLETFAMADRWRGSSIHPEAIREGASYFESLQSIVNTRSTQMAGTEWLPRVKKLKVGTMTKPDKIRTLYFRFDHGLIKLPMWRRMQHPWRSLISQIVEFNPDLPDGGLANDDCIDTGGMTTFVIKGRLHKPPEDPAIITDPVERLMKGETHDERTGIPLSLMVDWNSITPDALKRVLAKQEEAAFDEQQRQFGNEDSVA